MASFEGFIASTVTNIVPVLLSIYAVITGVNTLDGMISSLEKAQNLFLFTYYDATADALAKEQQTSHMLILLAVALIAYGLAVYFFQKRNLTVAEWPWRKAKIA
jgi:hypothetical protein